MVLTKYLLVVPLVQSLLNIMVFSYRFKLVLTKSTCKLLINVKTDILWSCNQRPVDPGCPGTKNRLKHTAVSHHGVYVTILCTNPLISLVELAVSHQGVYVTIL